MTVANETMRNDPARREAVRAQIVERQAAFAKAHALITEAYKTLAPLGPLTDDGVLNGCRDALLHASIRFDKDERSIMREPNDTYIGNKAAFGSPIGWSSPAEPTAEDIHARIRTLRDQAAAEVSPDRAVITVLDDLLAPVTDDR